MKRIMAIAVVLMIFAFSAVTVIHAQQTDMKDHEVMMSNGCPMMAKAEDAKCAMGNDGKCPMAADKCPMPSHHGSGTSTALDQGAP